MERTSMVVLLNEWGMNRQNTDMERRGRALCCAQVPLIF